MLFNSPIFLFVFLPATVGLYVLLRQFYGPRAVLGLLLGASLLFYAWWNPLYLPLLGAEVDFALPTSRHQVLNGIARRFALAKNGVHLLGDRHFYCVLTRKLYGSVGGVNTLGNHAVHASDDFWQFAAPPEFDANGAVAGEAAGAGENKIAQTRQS